MYLYHTPTPEELQLMTPEKMFLWLTSELYTARLNSEPETINAILSVFDQDARRALCVGAAVLRVMIGSSDTEYRSAIMHAMAETLYNKFNGGMKE